MGIATMSTTRHTRVWTRLPHVQKWKISRLKILENSPRQKIKSRLVPKEAQSDCSILTVRQRLSLSTRLTPVWRSRETNCRTLTEDHFVTTYHHHSPVLFRSKWRKWMLKSLAKSCFHYRSDRYQCFADYQKSTPNTDNREEEWLCVREIPSSGEMRK